MLKAGTDFSPAGERFRFARQQQRGAHDRLAQFRKQQMRHRVVGNPDSYRAPLRVLQAARGFAGRGQEERKGPRGGGLEQSKLPSFNARVASDLGQIGAHQRVVVVTVGVPEPADALQGSGITNMAAERIATVGRIGYQPAVAQDLRGLADQSRLRVLRVQFEILAQGANIRGRATPRPGSSLRK